MEKIYSKLSKKKQNSLVENFIAGTTARVAAELIGVNSKTDQLLFHKLREKNSRAIRYWFKI